MKVSELYDNYFHIEKLNQPYRNSREHLEELFSFLDLCFAAAMSARGLDSKKLLGAWEAGRLSDLSVSVQDIERLVGALADIERLYSKPEKQFFTAEYDRNSRRLFQIAVILAKECS